MEVETVKAKWVSLSTKRKLLLIGLLLWVIVLSFLGIAFLIVNFVLHKDIDVVFYGSALILTTPIIVMVAKEQRTWREVAVRFSKAIILVATGLLIMAGGLHLGFDIATDEWEGHPLGGQIIFILFTLFSLFWWIYFSVKAGQQLGPKPPAEIGGKKGEN